MRMTRSASEWWSRVMNMLAGERGTVDVRRKVTSKSRNQSEVK